MLLYWNILKYCADCGIELFDFGRSTPHEGTYRFKAQWGAKEKQLYWYDILLKNDNDADRTMTQHRFAHHKLKNYFIYVWRNLPIRITNYIGPKLRKYISL